jgi:hypothetical protein
MLPSERMNIDDHNSKIFGFFFQGKKLIQNEKNIIHGTIILY